MTKSGRPPARFAGAASTATRAIRQTRIGEMRMATMANRVARGCRRGDAHLITRHYIAGVQNEQPRLTNGELPNTTKNRPRSAKNEYVVRRGTGT